MKIGEVTKQVVSNGSKLKLDSASKRMMRTRMVIYKTYLGAGKFHSRTRHELFI